MLSYLIFGLAIAAANAAISDNCLNCICQVESNCNPNIGCVYDVYSDSCGPYQIKIEYYCDCQYIDPSTCGNYNTAWRNCANDYTCSSQCVRDYMARYGTYCTGGRTPTCEDYARIHNGGPNGCNNPNTEGYWANVQNCCATTSGC